MVFYGKNNPAFNRALAEEATSDFSPLPPHQVAGFGEQGFSPPYPVAIPFQGYL